MKIRNEAPEDFPAILLLTAEAFLTLDYQGRRWMDEHYLISLLRGSEFVIPELCFVVEKDAQIVGHILYTRSELRQADGTTSPVITFGPVSVLPEYQRQGIGAALIGHSLEKARELGHGAVVIMGVPDYYPRLGFQRGREYALLLPDGSAPDEFMAYELRPGYLQGGVFNLLAPEFEQAENDEEGFWSFHKNFMTDLFPGELRLRPLFDDDVALMEGWLRAEHVKPWFERPDEWLREIDQRRSEFSFIKHFIAEFEGIPIGFCQYYDMFYGQDYEDWLKVEEPTTTFSIDYLIGERAYLHRGLGQKMISMLLARLRGLGAKTVLLRPDRDNDKSNRALKANGFIWNGSDYILEL
ncbi:MAG: GNAT family N-acetyltransferase [Desulfovibrionales bacterium]|nr:GNAT family N-acetyltransferase [Desulfovibrionales bacterium]